MTNSRRFQRCRSLRVHKSPSLLDSVSGGIYDPLEEVDLTGRPARAGTRAKGLIPDTEKTQQNSAWNKGNWSRRATSLRVQKVAHDEATVTGEGVHSLGPGDGQLLIGEVNRKADSKVKKCKKVSKQEGRRSIVSPV